MRKIAVDAGKSCEPRYCRACVNVGVNRFWCPIRGEFSFDIFSDHKLKPTNACREAEVSP